jgi:hypothetical protein
LQLFPITADCIENLAMFREVFIKLVLSPHRKIRDKALQSMPISGALQGASAELPNRAVSAKFPG